jgi:hypothetical protein
MMKEVCGENQLQLSRVILLGSSNAQEGHHFQFAKFGFASFKFHTWLPYGDSR